MIHTERMTDFVLDLLRLDSHSREEKPVAEFLQRALRELGADVRIDGAGEHVNGNAGNVIARVPATAPSAAPLLLSAHMDVVPPARSVKPVREADRIRSDHSTVLGGDDKSGLAIIMEVLRTLRDHDVRHGTLEIAFTVCEEIGLLGAKALDYAALTSNEAIVLDSASAAHLVTAAPSADRFEFIVHGLESHAGVSPETGISAVRVAAQAIAAMPLGRIDPETTSNVVIADCSMPTNVVPNYCVVRGEARSLRDERLDEVMASIRRAFQAAAAAATVNLHGTTQRAWIEERCERDYHSMRVADDAPIVQLVFAAARALGAPMETVAIGGGSDASVYNRRGIRSVNLGTGMRDIHTVNEWLDLGDFYRSAEIVLECVKQRAAAQPRLAAT